MTSTFTELGWELSLTGGGKKGKTVAIAINDRLESLLKQEAARRGVQVVRHTRALGVDYSARARGRKRTAVQVARVRGARVRVHASTAARSCKAEGLDAKWGQPWEKPQRDTEHAEERQESCRRSRFLP